MIDNISNKAKCLKTILPTNRSKVIKRKSAYYNGNGF